MLTRITNTPAAGILRLLIDAERAGTPQKRALDVLSSAIGNRPRDIEAIISHERDITSADIEEIGALASVTRQSVGAFSYGFTIHRAHEDDEDEIEEGAQERFRFIMSTADSDRARDIVEQVWRLDEFRQNPVAPWGHRSSDPPVGIWHNVGVRDGALMGDLEPVPIASYPLSMTVAEQLALNVVRTVSVGFLPAQVLHRSSFDEGDQRFSQRGVVFRDNLLLECSPVSVPMNAGALVQDGGQERQAAPVIPGVLDWLHTTTEVEGAPKRSAFAFLAPVPK
jgi:hypothetical protein